MLFLGVLSVFQLILIPGLLLIRLFPAKRSLIQQMAVVFMLSLLANYAAVFLLVSVGFYLRSVVLALFAIEVVALFWLNREKLTGRIGFAGIVYRSKQKVSDGLASLAQWSTKDFWRASLYIVFGALAILGIIWVLNVWVQNFNTVFQTYDSWASWDRWAEKWADNRFPGDTWEYPQLIPITYSLAYKFIGTVAVKFFGKSIMPLFTLLIVLMLFDLGRKYRSFGYMLGAGLALFSISYFLGKYIPEGYVDIPVACFSLLAIYTLMKADGLTKPHEIKQTLLLGSLSTAAAAVTKQTGLYVMALYPFLAYFWVLRGNKKFNSRQAILLLAKHLLLVLLLVVPWYVVIEYHIQFGGNTSNIDYVINDIYNGQTLPQRFAAAVDMLGSYFYLYVFLFLSLFVLNAKFRQLLIFFVFPFSILWAFFLSYESRNLAVALPLVSMSTGVALENWVTRLDSLSVRTRVRLPVYGFVAIGLLLLGAGTLVYGEEHLINRQIIEQKKIFLPTLNENLYQYFKRQNGAEPVITDYPLDWLPGFKGIWRPERFRDYDLYELALVKYTDAQLLLIPMADIDPRILTEIQDRIASGEYELIFTESGYMLVRIPRD